jgi:hypothetical protein
VSFTAVELAVLRAGDAVISQETPEEKQARYSRESRERRRHRIGDDAYRAQRRAYVNAWQRKHRAWKRLRPTQGGGL